MSTLNNNLKQVVCHGCYDAPCQLKMSSIEGIERGASSEKVYVSARVHPAPLTRIFGNTVTHFTAPISKSIQ